LKPPVSRTYILENKRDIKPNRRGDRKTCGVAFWVAFVIYNLAVHFLFLLLWAPALFLRDFRSRFFSRLGFGLPRLDRSIIIHAASAGETLASREFVALLRGRFPGVPVVVTTVTTTGAKAAEYVGVDYNLGLPYDLLPPVYLALRRLNPVALILVECDFWPNLIYAALRRGIPIAVVNGRMTEKAASRYGAVGWLFKPLLASIAAYAVSDEEYVSRFRAVGVDGAGIEVTGNIKYDNLDMEPNPGLISEVHLRLGITDRFDLLIAGSTHEGEEELITRAYIAARDVRPSLKLLVAPRYPERAAAVVSLLSEFGITAGFYSNGGNSCDALVLDTIGDLASLYAAGAVAVVGGSFVSRGGQNVVEPAYAGCAVVYGPNTFHFPYEVRLLDGNGGTTVADGDELTRLLTRFYREPELLEAEMTKASAVAAGLIGGSARAVDFVMERWGMG
jgi:3-deoxy-D-manno-octulosonic-acid transferase